MAGTMKKVRGETAQVTGKYLYALVLGPEGKRYGHIGIDYGEVYTVSDGTVAAIVSDVHYRKIRPQRKHVAAQQRVLKGFMGEKALLPMSFGVIADSSRAVRAFLSSNREAILKQIQRVSGKVEIGLCVRWDVPNIFEYMVEAHLDLKSARDRLFLTGREPTHEEKIEIGKLFENVVNSEREGHFKVVEKILRPACSEIKRDNCRGELEVMKLACLIDRHSIKRLEDHIFEAAKLFDDNFAFDYTGPWWPHSFVELEIDF